MGGIGLVSNPRSRRNRKDPGLAGRLAAMLGTEGDLRQAHDLEELARIAEEFRRKAVDILAINGGDGTNSVTMAAFLKAYGESNLPPVALLRGGTMNTLAYSLGNRQGGPEEQLQRLLAHRRRDPHGPLPTVQRRIMRVGQDAGFLFGTGLTAGFLAEYYRTSPSPTPSHAALTLARAVGSALVGGETIRRMSAPFVGSVVLDDGTAWPERPYLAVTGGSIDHMGLGFRPFPRFAERQDGFHLLGIVAGPAQLALDVHRVWRGEGLRPGRALEGTPNHAIVRSAGGAPFLYMLDGDVRESQGELRVDTGPFVQILSLD
jgi:diacylglycerol kinase family enzyme